MDFDPKDIEQTAKPTGDFSPDDIHEDITPEAPISAAQSALAGAEQGLTVGLAPQLSTALPLLAEISNGEPTISVNRKLKEQGIKGDVGPTSLLEMYQQLRDNYLKENKKAAEAHPVANFAGNLAGGGLMMGGLGAAGATRTLGAITNPLGLAPEAGYMAKAGNAGISAAGMNTVYGAGSDNTNYIGNSPENVGKDVVGNALTGFITGNLVHGGASAVGGTVKAAGQLPVVGDVIAATKGAFNGKSYTGEAPAYQQENKTFSSKVVRAVQDLAYQKFQNKRAAVSAADEAVGPVDISNQLDSIIEEAKNLPEITSDQIKYKNEMLKYFDTMKNGADNTPAQTALLPSQIVTKARELSQAYPEGPDTAQAQRFMSSAADKLEEPLQDAIPNYDQLNKESRDAMSMFKRLTGKNIHDVSSSDPVANATLTDKVMPMVANLDKGAPKLMDVLGGFGSVPAGENTPAITGAKGMSTYAPNTADYIANRSQELSQDLRLSNLATSTNEFSADAWKAFFGGIAGLAVKGGEAAGGIARQFVGKSLPPEALNREGISRLLDLDGQSLQKVAEGISNSGDPNAAQYAASLSKAANSTGISKTAALYSLMQQPNFRNLMNSANNAMESAVSTPQVQDNNTPKGP